LKRGQTDEEESNETIEADKMTTIRRQDENNNKPTQMSIPKNHTARRCTSEGRTGKFIQTTDQLARSEDDD
jgi:hypothetical protein